MRTLKKNEQRMLYSLYLESETVYETDDDGNIIYYTDREGNKYPIEIGSAEPHYSTPVEFYASIKGTLNEAQVKEYGLDQSSIYSQITASKNAIPIVKGSYIWKESEVIYDDEGYPDVTSADYKVVGVLDESLSVDLYLLNRISKDDTE